MIAAGKMTNDLSTLIKLCWDKDPAIRPPMGNILPQIYDILLKARAISDYVEVLLDFSCLDLSFLLSSFCPSLSFPSCRLIIAYDQSELSCPDAIAMWKAHWPEKQEVPYINFATGV